MSPDYAALVAEARGFTAGSDPANARTALINDLARAVEILERDCDYMVVNADGLHRSGVELKERAEKAEQERDAARERQDYWRQRCAEIEERDAARDRRVAAEAWWEGVNDQWKHRPMGHRLIETANPYREAGS